MEPEPGQPLRVALVLSGAVSLGSYEAGVASELLAAVAQGAPLTLDLIAGSSAGALVGAMMLKTLAAGHTPAALENWTTFDLERLTRRYETARQAAARHKPLDEGLLSNEMVRQLCDQFVRQTLPDRSLRLRHPAPTLGLVLTLSNLDGLPGAGTPEDPGHFGEAVTFTLRPGDPERPAFSRWERGTWERIARVARASAAFPGAFDPERVPYAGRLQGERVQEQWADAAILDRLQEQRPGQQELMPYADGGIMDNHPLVRALNSLSLITPPEDCHCLIFDPQRCFLLVEPEPLLTSFAGAPPPQHLPQVVGRALQLLESSLVTNMPLRRTLAANERLLVLLRFLTGLARRLEDGGPPPHAELLTAPLPPHYAASVDAFYAWLAGPRFERDIGWLRGAAAAFINDRRPLLEALHKLRAAYLGLGDEGDGQRTLREAHVALGSQLGLTQPWVLVATLAPTDPEVPLHGTQVGHFGAFLSRAFLTHDFAAGRYYARRWLAAVLPGWDGPPRPAPPPSPGEIDTALLLANARPLARIAGRGLAALSRMGYDLPAVVRRALQLGKRLLWLAAAVQLGLWAVLIWLAARQATAEAALYAFALAAAAGALPLLLGFGAGLLMPRRPLFAALASCLHLCRGALRRPPRSPGA